MGLSGDCALAHLPFDCGIRYFQAHLLAPCVWQFPKPMIRDALGRYSPTTAQEGLQTDDLLGGGTGPGYLAAIERSRQRFSCGCKRISDEIPTNAPEESFNS
eukprot:1113926-Amphidinium_carterae.1